MKKLLLTLMIFTGSFILAESYEKITIDRLSSSIWGREFNGEFGYEIGFYKNNKFKTIFFAEGGDSCIDGSIIINDNKVAFSPENFGYGEYNFKTPLCKKIDQKSKEEFQPPSFNKLECYLKKTDYPLVYTEYLSCNNGKNLFWNKNSKVKAGTESKIGNYNIILLGYIDYETTTNLKFRKEPLINSEIIEVNNNMIRLPYITEGTSIKAIAHLKDKQIINGIKNYWYYVEVYVSHAYYKRGWVFGEYIKKINLE